MAFALAMLQYQSSVHEVLSGMEDIIIPLSLFTMIVLIVFLVHRSKVRHREIIQKERLALIEKGVTEFPEEIVRKKGPNLPAYMAWGFILTGIGLAVFIGIAIIAITGEEEAWNGLIGGLVPLFMGLGLLLFYKIQSKKEEEKSEKESLNTPA